MERGGRMDSERGGGGGAAAASPGLVETEAEMCAYCFDSIVGYFDGVDRPSTPPTFPDGSQCANALLSCLSFPPRLLANARRPLMARRWPQPAVRHDQGARRGGRPGAARLHGLPHPDPHPQRPLGLRPHKVRCSAYAPSEDMMPDAPRAPVPAARSRTSGTSSCSRASCRRSRCRSLCSLATRSAPRGTIGWSARTGSRSTSTLLAGTTPRPTCRRSRWRRVRCPPARRPAPRAAIADPPSAMAVRGRLEQPGGDRHAGAQSGLARGGGRWPAPLDRADALPVDAPHAELRRLPAAPVGPGRPIARADLLRLRANGQQSFARADAKSRHRGWHTVAGGGRDLLTKQIASQSIHSSASLCAAGPSLHDFEARLLDCLPRTHEALSASQPC